MEKSWEEMKAAAELKENSRTEAFRKGLKNEITKATQKDEAIQELMRSIGQQLESEAKDAMEKEIEVVVEKDKEKIKKRHAEEYGSTEWNDDKVGTYKKLLNKLFKVAGHVRITF